MHVTAFAYMVRFTPENGTEALRNSDRVEDVAGEQSSTGTS